MTMFAGSSFGQTSKTRVRVGKPCSPLISCATGCQPAGSGSMVAACRLTISVHRPSYSSSLDAPNVGHRLAPNQQTRAGTGKLCCVLRRSHPVSRARGCLPVLLTATTTPGAAATPPAPGLPHAAAVAATAPAASLSAPSMHQRRQADPMLPSPGQPATLAALHQRRRSAGTLPQPPH